MQHCYGHHNVSLKSETTSCLSIELHGVISLPDATSYDKRMYVLVGSNMVNKVSILKMISTHHGSKIKSIAMKSVLS